MRNAMDIALPLAVWDNTDLEGSCWGVPVFYYATGCGVASNHNPGTDKPDCWQWRVLFSAYGRSGFGGGYHGFYIGDK